MITFNKYMGVDVTSINQGTDDWLLSRAGVITASKAHDIIKKGRGANSVSEATKTYMNELIAQVCTAVVPEQIPFKQAAHGHEFEPIARGAFEAQTMTIVTEAGLIYKDDTLRCGASLDGLLEDEKETLEIKCPWNTSVHIATILDNKVKPEYITQYQFQLWVTGFEVANFASFDNRMRGKPENRIHITRHERDDAMMKTFDDAIPAFIESMDSALEKLGFAFGDQWK